VGILVALIVIAVVAVLVVRAVNKRRKPLEFKLSVVGFEACGKTVLLGCMYNELRVPDQDGIFLDTAPENAGKLLALYNATANPDAEFPDPTSKSLTEWPFTVKAKSGTGTTDVAHFSYLDFSGESLRDLFTTAINPETQRLYDRFKNSDVLLAALDGLQVKRFLEGRPSPRFHQDLGTLLALLSNHQRAVSLVLTKWDILEDHYTFRQVVDRLLQISQFANFVKAQQVFGSCRLIPVSSVGPGFVVEEGDYMRKVPGKQIHPVRVDLPIACALPDALAVARKQQASTPAAAAQQQPGLFGETGQQQSGLFAVGQQKVSSAQTVLLSWAQTVKVSLATQMTAVDSSRLGALSSYLTYAKGTPAAVAQLVTFCRNRVARFDAAFPESDLVGFMTRRGL
jgi:hypothetical protein